jgi:Fe-S oxidoreductase/nitrate reductase gamma subunit
VTEEPTREVFWGLSPGLEILWYALAVGSTLVFLYGIARPLAKYRRGGRQGLPPRGELGTRLATATRTVLAHATIGRREPAVGWAHRGILFGFATLFAGTVVLAVNTDVTERFFGWRFFDGDFYLGYSLVLDAMGIALFAGLLYMAWRRGVRRPPRLRSGRGDWTFLGVLAFLVLSGYLLEGVRIAMDEPGHGVWQPAGAAISGLYGWLGLGDGTLSATRHALWWVHGLVAIAFVAAIPFGKGTHMLQGYASLVLRDARAGKRLRAIPPEHAAEPAGYASLSDFSLTHLLQLDACTKCGRCHDVCPANAVGRPLSPRDLVLDLRAQADDALRAGGVGGVLGSLLGRQVATGAFDAPVVGDDRVRSETIWSCMQCNACVEVCPVGIEQAPIINQIRRNLVEEGDLDGGLQTALRVIHKSGNSFGENRRRRGRWTEQLDFAVKDARREPVDVLWFVGDYASFDPRSQQISAVIARLLREAGVDFGILYDGESNAGNDVRRAGEEGLFETLAERNIATLRDCEFSRIVTSDPHSLNTLRNEYPDLGGRWEVVHHTELLAELLASGALRVEDSLGYRVTYHDPCYLGRHNGVYDAPRDVLSALGCELVEMPRNRDNSFCCGAGGGQIWISADAGHERPSENRIREAVALGVELFVVACPKDVTMYEDAIKTTNSADVLILRELTELVVEATAARSAV